MYIQVKVDSSSNMLEELKKGLEEKIKDLEEVVRDAKILMPSREPLKLYGEIKMLKKQLEQLEITLFLID